MILGDTCTRACGFCAVKTGRPTVLDLGEPVRVAEAVERMGLKHAVITSVNRDELQDGGAAIFAGTIRQIRQRIPHCGIEVLIPDFMGDEAALATVMRARPDILNHNIETVPSLYPQVRPKGRYPRSLELLARAKRMDATVFTKSGIMLGLGEEIDEVIQVFRDLRAHDVEILTEAELAARGITCLDVDRGGDVTYHGPGQLVGYPIVDLGPRPDVGWYLRHLEDCLIETLADFGIAAGRLSGYTGVWIGDRKIAAIGVKVSQGVTTHGFALNVTTDLSLFTHILPCGIPDKGVTSMAVELGHAPAMMAVEDAVGAHFSKRFVLPGTPAAHVA